MKIKTKKSLGQNFLIDKNILKKISEIEIINNNSEIIEIGPGSGNLTEILIKKKPKKMFVIEKDDELVKVLKDKFQSIKIINADILNFSDKKIFSSNSIIYGNLPYNISSQILVKFIINVQKFKFKKLIFMFQKEMADRILAKVNTKNYGRLSILSNWKFNIKKVIDIKSNSFSPKPKVDSSLLIFSKKESYNEFKNPKNLEKITKIFFNQRRKKIKKPFNQLLGKNLKIIKKLNLNLDFRPQNLNPETYYALTNEYENLIK